MAQSKFAILLSVNNNLIVLTSETIEVSTTVKLVLELGQSQTNSTFFEGQKTSKIVRKELVNLCQIESQLCGQTILRST